MTYLTEEKPPLDGLVHYGVKGMKWGVRRTRKQIDAASKAAGYDNRKRSYDEQTHGRAGARRISKRIANGNDIATARQAEYDRRKKVQNINRLAAAGVVAAITFGPELSRIASEAKGTAAYALNNRANRKRQEAGERAARDIFAEDRGITNYHSVRLSFNSKTGEWE